MIIAQRSIKCFTFNQNCSFIYSLNIKQSYCIQLQLQFQSWPLSTLSIHEHSFISHKAGRDEILIYFSCFFLHIIHFSSSSYSPFLYVFPRSLTHFNSIPMDDYCQYITKKKPLDNNNNSFTTRNPSIDMNVIYYGCRHQACRVDPWSLVLILNTL